MSTSPVVYTLSDAIAQFESGGNPNSVSNQNNNPGNLVPGNLTAAFGGTAGGAGGFAQFPTGYEGAMAEDQLVGNLAGNGDTIAQLVDQWAGTAYGNSQASVDGYVAALTKATGLSADTPLNSAAATGTATQSSTSGTTTTSTSTPASTPAQTSSSPSSWSSWFSAFSAYLNPENLVVGIIGFILLAGGILMLKTTQTVIQSSVKAGKKVAAFAA
jgi:hypothetical protein